MAYAGASMISGQGAGVVVATGDHTETGRISRLTADSDLTTPLTRRMAVFGNWVLIAIGLLAALTFAVGMSRGESGMLCSWPPWRWPLVRSPRGCRRR
ncbi:MAG: hypothetical protein IPN78_03990 [Candidatus Accumulibacter sp.]|nr:hypothetical protein [Candidatus Accumulibacter propinquus]